MKNVLIIIFCLVTHALFAHSGNETHANLKDGSIASEGKIVTASLMMLKGKTVFLEDAQHQIVKYPLSALKLEDQLYVIQKYKKIEQLNTPSVSKSINWGTLLYKNFWLCVWFLTLLFLFLIVKLYKNKFAFKYAYYGVFIGIILIFLNSMPKQIWGTDPLFIDSSFAPFKPKVKTHYLIRN